MTTITTSKAKCRVRFQHGRSVYRKINTEIINIILSERYKMSKEQMEDAYYDFMAYGSVRYKINFPI